ncbi:hypothetical protein GGX14DRAFT_392092 [Mycena pura]|uniref:Uncharacterized protein n=1 Tax=Mycena pura TaxID=153505 RepID=A0AAD6YFT5_9AGAR|nr:hypothetical protein GGX14DRAFT_392092 [Mycena pura]
MCSQTSTEQNELRTLSEDAVWRTMCHAEIRKAVFGDLHRSESGDSVTLSSSNWLKFGARTRMYIFLRFYATVKLIGRIHLAIHCRRMRHLAHIGHVSYPVRGGIGPYSKSEPPHSTASFAGGPLCSAARRVHGSHQMSGPCVRSRWSVSLANPTVPDCQFSSTRY